MKRISFFLIFFFILNQNKAQNEYFDYIKFRDYSKALDYAKTDNDSLLVLLSKSLLFNGERNIKIENIDNISTKLSENKKNIIGNLTKGYYNLIYKNNSSKAFTNFYDAYLLSEKLDNKKLTKICLIALLDLYRKEIFYGNAQHNIYLDKFKEYSTDTIDSFLLTYYNLVFLTKTIYEIKSSYNYYLKKFDSFYKNNNLNDSFLTMYYNEKALSYRIKKEHEKAIFYFKKALELNKTKPYSKAQLLSLQLNIGDLYLKLNKKNTAKKHFTLAKQYVRENKKNYDLFYYHRYISNYYLAINKPDSAYFNLNKSINIEYDLNYKANSLEISQLNKLFETERKEKENLQLKVERKQTKNWLIASLITLVLGSIIAYQSLRSSIKKRQLAEQQKQLEQQKNSILLKEQEISIINAMIEGQEIERKEIAEDLHDNIGSVLATLKLHFENLKLNRKKKHFNQDELYNKTEKLIDETYYKIRNISHAKNAGVIANQGLLKALKIMAEKISSANKTQIDVVDFGLDTRIENALEISIFRIIQELTTNIIKHANAKKATINISKFKDILNVIIEDNGKGFNPSKVSGKKGIGLDSIKTRIQHLKGTFEIDSSIGNGTTIIINIPITN